MTMTFFNNNPKHNMYTDLPNCTPYSSLKDVTIFKNYLVKIINDDIIELTSLHAHLYSTYIYI